MLSSAFNSDHATDMCNAEYRRSFKRVSLRVKLYDLVMNLLPHRKT